MGSPLLLCPPGSETCIHWSDELGESLERSRVVSAVISASMSCMLAATPFQLCPPKMSLDVAKCHLLVGETKSPLVENY